MSQGTTTRGQIKRNQSVGTKADSAAESNTMGKEPKGGSKKSKNSKNSENYVLDKGGAMDMNALLKHMEEMQKRTEKSLTESVTKSIEESKTSINKNMSDMITALKVSVDDLKENLQGVKESFQKEIDDVKDRMRTVESKVKIACGDISRLEHESRSERTNLTSKLQRVEGDTEKALKQVNTQLSCLRKEMETSAEEFQRQHRDQELKFENYKREMEEEMDKLKIRAYGNSCDLRQHATQIESLDVQVRAQNVIIDGLPEKPDAESKSELLEIIHKTLPQFKENSIRQIRRLGKVRGKKKKPRPILVSLNDQNSRDTLISKAADIKKGTDNAQFWINRDQSDSAKRRHGLVKACFKLMQANKLPCSMKGSAISYNNKLYDYDSLNLLPDPCRPYHVKSRETTDGKGLCFALEHVFCSNFSSARVRYKGQLYTSVEHAYQTIKVKDAGYIELASEMLGMINPYNIKKIGGSITASKEWKKTEEQLMEELIRAKFNQNPRHKALLLESEYENYFEMTADRKWATGVRLTQSMPAVDPKTLRGKNVVGSILSKIKRELLESNRATNSPSNSKAVDSLVTSAGATSTSE